MRINKRLISIISNILVASIFFTGCSNYSEKHVSSRNIISEKDDLEVEEGKNAEDLNIKSIMEQLTCDEYLSRVVGSDENTKSSIFIKNYFEAIGLKPFNDGSYYQEVNLSKAMRSVFTPSGDSNNTVNNVLGVIYGEDNSKAIVISAHFDHITLRSKESQESRGKDSDNIEPKEIIVDKIQGAIDNASGVAVLLETAKSLSSYYKDKKPPYDIIFASFNAEELGLIGSSKFVSDFKNNYDDWYDINIDCVGIKGDEGLAVKNTNPICQELYDDFIKVLDEDNIYYEMVPYAMNKEGAIVGSSDHMVFRRENDASLIIGQDGITDIVHSKDDNMEIVDFELIENIKDALVDFIVKTDNKIY